jgi:hypothetical protein
MLCAARESRPGRRNPLGLITDEEAWPLRLTAVEAGKWGAAVRDADDALMFISS